MSINTTFFYFLRWRPSDILNFLKFEISTACLVGRPICVIMPNVVPIGQTVAVNKARDRPIAIFEFFKMTVLSSWIF